MKTELAIEIVVSAFAAAIGQLERDDRVSPCAANAIMLDGGRIAQDLADELGVGDEFADLTDKAEALGHVVIAASRLVQQ